MMPESCEVSIEEEPELRVCRSCKEAKPLATEYYLYTNGKPYGQCKDCIRQKTAEYRKPIREAMKEATAERRRNKPPVEPPTSKVCRGCNAEKPIEEFRSPKGRQYHRCYACIRAQNDRYLEGHREEMTRKQCEKSKVRRRTDPAFRAREKRNRDRRLATNPVSPEAKARYNKTQADKYRFDPGFRRKARESIYKYRDDNPETVAATRRKHYRKHKARFLARNHNREARKLGNGGTHTAEQWEALKAHYDYRCLVCGRQEPEIRLTRDHIVPVVHGGRNDVSNLQPLCLRGLCC